MDPVVRGDRMVDQGEVARDRGRHRRPIPLPERGAPLDVGEEEGDGAAGEIGHGPLPFVRPVVVLADCRMSDGQTTSEWLTIASSVAPRLTGTSTGVPPVNLRLNSDEFVALASPSSGLGSGLHGRDAPPPHGADVAAALPSCSRSSSVSASTRACSTVSARPAAAAA